jgi:hypothetical protein
VSALPDLGKRGLWFRHQAVASGRVRGPVAVVGGDDGNVGWGEGVLVEFLGTHPGDFIVFPGVGFGGAAGQAGDEGVQGDGDCFVAVVEDAQVVCYDEDAVQFLADLAGEGRGRALGGLDFAAGKLPEPAQMLTGGPAGQQHAVVAFDEGTHDGEGGGRDGHPPMHRGDTVICNF